MNLFHLVALALVSCSISELETRNKLVLFFLQERLLTLKKQAAQTTQQAQREKESFLKERSNLEAMLQRVRGYPHLHVYACDRVNFIFNIVFHFLCFFFCLLGKRKPLHAGKKICWPHWWPGFHSKGGRFDWQLSDKDMRTVLFFELLKTLKVGRTIMSFPLWGFLLWLLGYSLSGWCVSVF